MIEAIESIDAYYHILFHYFNEYSHLKSFNASMNPKAPMAVQKLNYFIFTECHPRPL
jgi:hypothetical protein